VFVERFSAAAIRATLGRHIAIKRRVDSQIGGEESAAGSPPKYAFLLSVPAKKPGWTRNNSPLLSKVPQVG
jgi:hypothetical protein